MVQMVLSGDSRQGTAGILLKCFAKIGSAGKEEGKPDHHEKSGGQKIIMEILYPAKARLPETGEPLLILPESRTGILLHFRITGSNSVFLRLTATVRLNGGLFR